MTVRPRVVLMIAAPKAPAWKARANVRRAGPDLIVL